MTTDEILELITDEDIIDIMDDLGSPVMGTGVTSDGQKYYKFKTICHCGNSSKCYYYAETKNFYCYTCCGALSVFNMVQKVKGYTNEQFFSVVKYITDKIGIEISSNRNGVQDKQALVISDLRKDMEYKKELRERDYSVPDITKFYDPKILEYFDKDTFYEGWLNEGISPQSMEKFGISFYWLENHIIIPHFDINGNLVGIRRRSLKSEDKNCKYMPEKIENTFYEHPLGLNLYGLFQNKVAISRFKKAIVLEGEKSVLLSDTYFGEDSVAVATCGFNISKWQIRALKKLGVNKIYLGFDKDYDINKEEEYKKDKNKWEGYLRYRKRIDSFAKKLVNNFQVYIIWDKKGLLQEKDSPFDRGKEICLQLIKDAQRVGF